VQQLLEPASRHLLEGQGGRGERGVEGALIPADREQVGDECGVHRSADHEAEIAWSSRSHQTRLGSRDELLDDRLGWAGILGKRLGKRRGDLVTTRDRCDPRRRETFPIGGDQLDGPLQRLPSLVHRRQPNRDWRKPGASRCDRG
jgi:hypothetical protein